MNMSIIVLLGIFSWLCNFGSPATLGSDGTIDFGTLKPRETKFNLKTEVAFGILSPYYWLASCFSGLFLPFGLPWDEIGDAIVKFNESDAPPTDMLAGSIGYFSVYLFLIFVGLLFICFFPIVACCFCGCYCCLKSCQRRRNEKEKSKPKIIVLFALTIANLVVILGLCFTILLVSSSITANIPSKQLEFIDNVIPDIKLFLNNTLLDVDDIVSENMDFMEEIIGDELRNIPNTVIKPTFAEYEEKLSPTAKELDKEIESIVANINKYQTGSKDLLYGDTGDHNMKKVSDKIQQAYDAINCASDSACTNTKTEINKAIIPASTTITVDDMALTVDSIYDLLTKNFEKTENDTIDEIQPSIDSNLATIENKTREVDSLIDENVKPLTDEVFNFSISEYIPISDIRDDAENNFIFGFLSAIFLLLPIIVIFLLVVIGIIFAMFARLIIPEDSSKKTKFSKWASFFLIIAGFLSLITTYYYLSVAFPFFVVLTPASEVCSDIQDNTIISELLDKPYLFDSKQKYFISSNLLKNDTIPLTLEGIINGCEEGKTAYNVMKISGSEYDIKSIIDIDSMVPEASSLVNIDLSKINIYSEVEPTIEDAQTQLNDLEGKLSDLKNKLEDVDRYKKQLKDGALTTATGDDYFDKTECKNSLPCKSLESIIQDLTSMSSIAGVPDAIGFLNEANSLTTEMFNDYEVLGEIYSNLTTSISTVKTKLGSDSSSTGFAADLKALEADLKANVEQNVTKRVEGVLGTVKSYLNQFVDYIIDSLDTTLGKCDGFVVIWKALVVQFCDYVVEELVGMYFAIGLLGLFSFTLVILCFKLVPQLKTSSKIDEFSLQSKQP